MSHEKEETRVMHLQSQRCQAQMVITDKRGRVEGSASQREERLENLGLGRQGDDEVGF